MSESGRRREQPQIAVKEKRDSGRPSNKGGLFGEIFGAIKNPLVPAAKPVAPREETIRTQDTLTPHIHPKAPVQEKAIPGSPVRPTRRDRDRKKEDQNNSVIYALAVAAAIILWLGMQTMGKENAGSAGEDRGAGPDSQVTDLRERVEYYRKSVGHKLNRERVGTEYENRTSAPRLNGQAKKVSESDMMNGLPLATEQHHRASSRDRAEPANPDYSDAHIAYSLREQQQLNEADRRAQKQYMDEFVANAAKAGYKVKIDKYGNVNVVGRQPAGGSRAGPSSSGSMQ